MKLTTEGLPADQQNITLEVQPEAEELARGLLLAWFETEARNGVRFQAGQTVEVGGMQLLLQQKAEELEVMEPDFDCMPIRWRNSVDNCIRHFQLQRAVCDLFGSDPSFSNIRQAGVISPEFLASTDYRFTRCEPSGMDSGWLFAESGYSGNQGEFCSLYQIMLSKMEIIPFLALPPSSEVTIKPGFRQVVVGSITRSSDDDAFLHRLAISAILI